MANPALTAALLLCCTATAARADGPKPASRTLTAPSHKGPKQATGHRRTKPAPARAAAASVQPIVGTGADSRAGAALADLPRSADGAAAWSVSPRWSASNGGTSAAYGTRALVNELHANPAETTGYGAGAQVDFHF